MIGGGDDDDGWSRWCVQEGKLAPEAAGVIHTDIEKNFICAEVQVGHAVLLLRASGVGRRALVGGGCGDDSLRVCVNQPPDVRGPEGAG